MTTTWHGYPQADGAHPERPWWRKAGRAWERTDGHAVTPIDRVLLEDHGRPFSAEHKAPDGRPVALHGVANTVEALARVDAALPLPVPLRLVGQVWVQVHATHRAVSASVHRAVVVVDPQGAVRWSNDPGGTYDGAAYYARDFEWPPLGAVLVAGPGAPWMDTREGR